MKALITILATVWPIEALSNLIVFTKPWDFEKESFRLFTLEGSHRITQKATYMKYFFFTWTKLSHTRMNKLLFLAATIYCSELIINKLHAKFWITLKFY